MNLDPTLDRYLGLIFDQNYSEISLAAGQPVTGTLNGERRVLNATPQDRNAVAQLLGPLLTPKHRQDLVRERALRVVTPSPRGKVRVEVFAEGADIRVVIAPAAPRPQPPAGTPIGNPVAAPVGAPPGSASPVRTIPPPPMSGTQLPTQYNLSGSGPVSPVSPLSSSAGLQIDVAPAYEPAPPAPPASPADATYAKLKAVQAAVHSGGSTEEIDKLFHDMIEKRASDLHLSPTRRPYLRIDGEMKDMEKQPRYLSADLERLIFPIMPERNRREYNETNDTDFAYEITGLARFRCNVFRDRHGTGAVFRQIPSDILTAEDLKLPKCILDLCFLPKGLVLVTGPTGSGKSTTLAAIIDFLNRHRPVHIITIEDPIEFVHEPKQALINQREVNVHTESFKKALRAALREDPDVVLVGEMRDLETISIAIETAETGHLVFGTLHTNNASSTVDRVIDQFSADRQNQIRTMLSESLAGVISQTLAKKTGGGRVAALEILICTGAVSNLIREGKTFQIPSVMQVSRGIGMQMMEDSLADLVKKKVITPQEAYQRSIEKETMKKILENMPGVKARFDDDAVIGAKLGR